MHYAYLAGVVLHMRSSDFGWGTFVYLMHKARGRAGLRKLDTEQNRFELYFIAKRSVLPYSLDITPPSFISPPFHWLRDGRLVASWWWYENCIAFLTAHTLRLHYPVCPAELSHYELYRKPHETVTDNSAIAVSFARSAARKGGV